MTSKEKASAELHGAAKERKAVRAFLKRWPLTTIKVSEVQAFLDKRHIRYNKHKGGLGK